MAESAANSFRPAEYLCWIKSFRHLFESLLALRVEIGRGARTFEFVVIVSRVHRKVVFPFWFDVSYFCACEVWIEFRVQGFVDEVTFAL